MNGSTILGGLICFSLSGVIAAELLTDIRSAKPLVASAPVATANSPESEPPAAPGNRAALAQTIEERPLFSPGRKPVAASMPARQVDTTVKPFGRRLTGIVVEPQMRAAVFAGEGARPVAVKEGEPIDGWFLETVTSVSVTMRSAGTVQVIALIKSKTPINEPGTKPATPSFISPVLQVPPPSMAAGEPVSRLRPSSIVPAR